MTTQKTPTKHKHTDGQPPLQLVIPSSEERFLAATAFCRSILSTQHDTLLNAQVMVIQEKTGK